MFLVPSHFRVTKGQFGTDDSAGNNGCFYVRGTRFRHPITCIASDGGGWEHVSASLKHRCPTWVEMCKIKDLFWGEDDFVVQMHPTKSDYVNDHKYTLHLWRKKDTNDFCEKPPKIFV